MGCACSAPRVACEAAADVAAKAAGGARSWSDSAPAPACDADCDVFYDAPSAFADVDALPLAFARAAAGPPAVRPRPVRAPSGALLPAALAAAASAAPAATSAPAAMSAADDTTAFASHLVHIGDALAAERIAATSAATSSAPAAPPPPLPRRHGLAGGAGGARRMLSTLRSVCRLRHVDLSSFTAAPIALYLPFSTVQMLTWHSHHPGRPPPLARLAIHARAAAVAASARRGDPMARLLAALRCQLAALDLPPPSLLSPMDAVAGETSRLRMQLPMPPGALPRSWSGGAGRAAPPPVHGIAEFVSDAPSERTTAYAALDVAARAAAHGWVNVLPRFAGLSIRIAMHSLLTLRLPTGEAADVPFGAEEAAGDGTEVYRCTVPSIDFSLLPRMGAAFIGTWRLWCDATGLAVELTHAPQRLLSGGGSNGGNGGNSATLMRGRVLRYAPPWSAEEARMGVPPRVRAVVCLLKGTLEGALVATPCGDDATSACGGDLGAPSGVVWELAAVVAAEAAAPAAAPADAGDALASEVVWGAAARALSGAQWDAARAHKGAVDAAAAAARAARAAGRAPGHVPAFFVRGRDGWAPRV